jgi:hypothetical protein
MKKHLKFTIAFLLVSLGISQPESKGQEVTLLAPKIPQNIVKINLVSPVFGTMEMSYERLLLHNRIGLQFNASLMSMTGYSYNWNDVKGGSLGLNAKLYAGNPMVMGRKFKTWLRGFYLSPDVSVRFAAGNYNVYDYYLSINSNLPERIAELFGSLDLGYQFKFLRACVFDVFGGVGYNKVYGRRDFYTWDIFSPGYMGMKPRGGVRVGVAF